MTPLISVIIVTYNSAKWLSRCLESLRAQTIADKIEVILVDNNSDDECKWPITCLSLVPSSVKMVAMTYNNAPAIVAMERPVTKHIQTGSNLGFVANNIGAQHARGKYLYLLNPDTWLHPYCLEHLYIRAEHENAHIVGSAVEDYSYSGGIASYGADGFDTCGEPIESHDPKQRDLLSFSGFCFIRRDWFIHIGQLNESLFMYGEEWDLSWRTWLAGGKVVLEPSAIVHHYSGDGTTSACKRFLANRNAMVVTACNAQHVLLLTLLPLALLVLAEAFWLGLTRVDWHWLKRSGLDPFSDLWRLRLKIMEQRYCVRTYRKRGDWWMLRFLRLGFARWMNRPKQSKQDRELMQTIEKWRTG